MDGVESFLLFYPRSCSWKSWLSFCALCPQKPGGPLQVQMAGLDGPSLV